MRHCIGLVGTFGAGKDTVGELIAEQGYEHISTGDLVREEIRRRDEADRLRLQPPDLSRDNQQRTATGLRELYGEQVLVDWAWQHSSGNCVVSGLRNPGEVRRVRSSGGAVIAVDAPIEERYERLKLRSRIDDSISFERFSAQQNFEMNSGSPNGQHIAAVMAAADIGLYNDAGHEDLRTAVETVLLALDKLEELELTVQPWYYASRRRFDTAP